MTRGSTALVARPPLPMRPRPTTTHPSARRQSQTRKQERGGGRGD